MDIIKEKERQLRLYRLTRLIREIYPNTPINNPYRNNQNIITEMLNEDEKLLFNDVLESITLLNGEGRKASGRTLQSTEQDYLNALKLVMPKENMLSETYLDHHRHLREQFKDEGFTYLEARHYLKKSMSGVKRIFNVLELYGLLKRHHPKHGRATFWVMEKEVEDKGHMELFEDMQGEWKDFIGFVEF
jgi:hypothetical protein